MFGTYQGFPDSSVGKASACNAGDPNSIPGSGRSPEEGVGYLLQYSWVSLVVQLVKNPLAVWETWVWSLGWEDPLEKEKATHSSILAGEFHGLYSPGGRKESNMTERLSLSLFTWYIQTTNKYLNGYMNEWKSDFCLGNGCMDKH